MPPCFATRIFYGAGFFVDAMEWLMYSTRDIKYLGKKITSKASLSRDWRRDKGYQLNWRSESTSSVKLSLCNCQNTIRTCLMKPMLLHNYCDLNKISDQYY